MIEAIARRNIIFHEGYKRRIQAKSYGPGIKTDNTQSATNGSLATKDRGIDLGTRDLLSSPGSSMAATSSGQVKRVKIMTSNDWTEPSITGPVDFTRLPADFDF